MINQQQIDLLINLLNDGANNAINAPDIEDELDLPEGNTQEMTRNLIRNCINQHNFPIGSNRSNNRGYFLINTEEELNEVIDSFESRIAGLRQRIQNLQEGWRLREESRRQDGNWPK